MYVGTEIFKAWNVAEMDEKWINTNYMQSGNKFLRNNAMKEVSLPIEIAHESEQKWVCSN